VNDNSWYTSKIIVDLYRCQEACDAGERPELRDPVAVALAFEEDWSGRELSPDAFVLEGTSDLSEFFDLHLATVELENGVGG
ncbi:hypothetical protein, partial [Flavonifractor sp.]|uniref:hypothetical protein n=1 Tax=Flavonifractor sp. TaxID=2049025 RepID=UPI00307B9ACA